MDKIPTVGEWYRNHSKLFRIFFNILCRIIGDDNAIELFGYRRCIRDIIKKRELK